MPRPHCTASRWQSHPLFAGSLPKLSRARRLRPYTLPGWRAPEQDRPGNAAQVSGTVRQKRTGGRPGPPGQTGMIPVGFGKERGCVVKKDARGQAACATNAGSKPDPEAGGAGHGTRKEHGEGGSAGTGLLPAAVVLTPAFPCAAGRFVRNARKAGRRRTSDGARGPAFPAPGRACWRSWNTGFPG